MGIPCSCDLFFMRNGATSVFRLIHRSAPVIQQALLPTKSIYRRGLSGGNQNSKSCANSQLFNQRGLKCTYDVNAVIGT